MEERTGGRKVEQISGREKGSEGESDRGRGKDTKKKKGRKKEEGREEERKIEVDNTKKDRKI